MARYHIVTVVLEDGPDGGLRVRSDDLPGLILAGPDKRAVVDCIAPAIQALFEHNGGHAKVSAAQPISAFLGGESPRTVDMHIERFVVEVAEAA